MKRQIISCLGLFSLFCFFSCNMMNNTMNNRYMSSKKNYEPTNHYSIQEAEEEIGVVNQVFYSQNTARFFTDQIIKNLFGFAEVKFYGELVEYNSVDKKILDYVESLESNNAAMHQSYQNMTYDASKKYVELSSYTDTSTNEIVAYEVRIFWGNFMETFRTEGWYAKSVTFTPDLKVDIYAGKNIETGESVRYWGTTANNTNYTKTRTTKKTNEYPALLNKFGTISAVYTNYDKDGEIEKITYDDGTQRFTSYYAEYSVLDTKVINYFSNKNYLSLLQSSYDVNEDSTKYYIEYIEYIGWGKSWIY